MNKIFIPADKPEDWKSLLAEPDKQWKTGYSAKALAYCWQEANDFPECVINVFKKSGIKLFQNIELLLAIPEYKVTLPGGPHPSQNDIFVLAKGNNQLVSIMVEGKVSEPFGETVAEWRKDNSKGKGIRLKFLLGELGLEENKQIDTIRYQLLHRTASAIIEAKQIKAENALMLVHSFSRSNEWFDDYSQFLTLFGLSTEPDSLVFAKNINGINLYFSWVKGDEKYLNIESAKMNDLTINTTIEQLKEEFQKYPDIFLTESDVRCHLFSKLLNNSIFSEIKRTADGSNSIDLHSEVRWYGEDRGLKFRSDIVIIDASDLKTKNSTIFKLPSKGYGFNRFSAIIEVKLRRKNGSPDDAFIHSIRRDMERLEEISQKVSPNFSGFLVIFDKKNNIESDIRHIEMNNRMKVTYAYGANQNERKDRVKSSEVKI